MFIESFRNFDYKAFFFFYDLGKDYDWFYSLSLYAAKFGIVIFFLSFIYLILKRKIPAFLCALFSMGLAGIVDFIVFALWQRPNPYITYSKIVSVSLNGMPVNSGSFPSSHTYVAFAIATSLILFGHIRLGLFLLLIALLIALSRIVSGYHYPSDIIGGIILGVMSGILMRRLFRHWEKFSYEKNGGPL